MGKLVGISAFIAVLGITVVGCTAGGETEPIPDDENGDLFDPAGGFGERPEFDNCAGADAIATRADYHKLTDAEEKLSYHLEWVRCTEYDDLPRLSDSSGFFESVLTSLISFKQPTTLNPGRAFDTPSDTNPEELQTGREKFIHTTGSVARVRFEREPSLSDGAACFEHPPYTGLLENLMAAESPPALMRLGWAADPKLRFSKLTDQLAIGYLPGAAVKWFLDGDAQSVNALAFAGFEGATERESRDASNFFSQTIGTAVENPHRIVGDVVGAYLGLFADMPKVLSVKEIAGWTPDGVQLDSDEIADPFSLVFEPRVEAFETYANARGAEDSRVRFAEMSEGDPVYDLWARPSESSECLEYVTTIVLDSRLMSSQWGDWTLFFRHPVAGQR